LPDGFFSGQKSQFGYILQDLGIENVVIYFDHWEYFTTIGYILWAFGYFVVIWHTYTSFGISHQEKSGNPAENQESFRSDLPVNLEFQSLQPCQPVFECLPIPFANGLILFLIGNTSKKSWVLCSNALNIAVHM
jgi:hypothetical protein